MNATTALTTVKNTITRTAGQAKLGLIRHSPEILIGAGVVSIVAGTILACRATLKVEDILNDHAEKKAQISQNSDMGLESYTGDDAKKDRAILLARTTGKMIRLYAVPTVLISGGIACFMGAYGIMKSRNAALAASLSAVTTAFDEYRARVRQELGEEADDRFRYGYQTRDGVDQDGNEIKAAKVVDKDRIPGSPYARFFDERSLLYKHDNQTNLRAIMAAQNYANQTLNCRGYIFLNDVYDFLGLDATPEGQTIGWTSLSPNPYVEISVKEVYSTADCAGPEDLKKDWLTHKLIVDFNPEGDIISKMNAAVSHRRGFDYGRRKSYIDSF